MSLERLFDHLDRAIASPLHQHGEGSIYIPTEPIELEQLDDLVENSELNLDPDDYDEDDLESGEYSLAERLSNAGKLRMLLTCEWSIGAPMETHFNLNVLDAGEHGAYLIQEPDEGFDDPALVIARLTPGDSTDLYTHFITSYFGTNGDAYKIQVFASLPNEITITAPDLVSDEAVRAGLQAYVALANSDGSDPWTDMADIAERLERQQFLSFGTKPKRPPVPEAERETVFERYLEAVVSVEE
ncbi:MAG: hypothetical protein RLZZ387_3973 [Chloroflexota bacterium]|jgi:hypothetical protein